MVSVYADAKLVLLPDRIEALRAGDTTAPIHIRVKPTNVCNHSCSYCAYRADDLSLGSDMNVRDRIPREKMLELIEDFISMGVRAVTFSGGGEPMLYPHIVETVERLAEGGIKIGSLTNGSRLNGKVADAFARHATWVRVSIDGWDGPSYAQYRTISEDKFDELLDILKAFSDRGTDCVLGTSMIVDDRNAPHIADLASRLKGAGVQHMKVSPCVISNSAYHERIAAGVADQIKAARELEDESFTVVDHYHTADDSYDKSYHSCPFLNLLTVVGANCRVYPCQDKAYTDQGLLGSLRSVRFRDLWHSREVRQTIHDLDPTLSCRHHCVADAKNRLLHQLISLDSDHATFV
jgi:MoaA/NifB/PqqE/SkfB family radical SAM enzyme